MSVKKRNEYRLQMIHNPSEENLVKYKQYKELANTTIRRQKRLCEKKALK